MDYSSLLELVKQRRSIRGFKPEAIPGESVNKIIEVARWAPSGSNAQPWEFVVVQSPELRGKIAEMVKNRNNPAHRTEPADESKPVNPPRRLGIEDAPVYIILCGDTRTKEFGHSSDTFRAELTLHSGLASAFLYMHLAATTLGLASQWVSATASPSLQPRIKELLGIPEEMEIYDLMAVGYPAAAPRPRLVRAREEMVHHDYFDKNLLRTEEKIREVATAHHHG